MIRTACYLAIFLHFLRKIFRRAVPPAMQDGVHRYLVLMGPYRDDKIGSMAAVAASTNDIVLGKNVSYGIKAACNMAFSGESLGDSINDTVVEKCAR